MRLSYPVWFRLGRVRKQENGSGDCTSPMIFRAAFGCGRDRRAVDDQAAVFVVCSVLRAGMRRHGSRLMSYSAASRPATPLSWSMCVNPRNSVRLRATCPVPSTCRWPIYRAGPENLPPGDNRSWWFVKPIADQHGQRQSCLPPAYGMSPSFVAEQTGGTDKGWVSNSCGSICLSSARPAHQPRLQAAPPSTQNLAQWGD
jgi:hypothetical protein